MPCGAGACTRAIEELHPDIHKDTILPHAKALLIFQWSILSIYLCFLQIATSLQALYKALSLLNGTL